MFLRLLCAVCVLTVGANSKDWLQFRGPNSSGIADETNLPDEFGPSKNVVWKTALPPGHSSPIVVGDRIFLTAFEADKLLTFCLDRVTGKIQWRRESPRPRTQELHKSNTPASPSAVSDGKSIYVFFTDFGLISYGLDGNERWKTAMGPFNNPFGMGASPVLVDNILLQSCDAESGSYFAAFDKNTGKELWRSERPEYSRGFSTPVLYEPAGGPKQAILAGSYQLTSYDVKTGKPVWWFRGLTWQLKPTPVLNKTKDTVYVLGWAGGSDTGQQESIADFADVLKLWDKDGDKLLSKEEIPDDKVKKDWGAIDLDRDGKLGDRDWKLYQSRRAAQNMFQAIRLGPNPKGDITANARSWAYTKSLPNVPSPLFYDDVLYLMKEGGILTSINPADGSVYKQGRLQGALSQYFASPLASGGKLYMISETGNVVVLKAGKDWEIIKVNDMDDEVHATPAMVDGRIYLRTKSALYCFAKKD
ncbi:MAG: PQQ-binding-like beta-propeller repeat protein [Candidatus Solibacter usitatus]|nr:PQQ-binding-like beta-propeller repeat protein [Candidatus Solibacter usitatus]